MHLIRRLLIVRWALYGAILSAVSFWALTSTEVGQTALQRGLELTGGYARIAPGTLGRLAEDERFDAYIDEARRAAGIAGDSAGVFTDQASALAYVGAAALPDPEDLAAALEGWQSDLIEYEAQLRAEMGEGATQAQLEARMEELFRPRTIARRVEIPPPPTAPVAPAPAAPAPEVEPEAPDAAPDATPDILEPEPETLEALPVVTEPATVSPASARPPAIAFVPHPAFYKCPVIEVSNSGPVDGELTLTEYTPWVETPAGVLIRAPVAGACLSSGYGPRMVEGASKNHGGVDYYNRDGTAIFAAGDGVVTQAGEDAAYGHSVRIDHGGGVEGHYAHMVAGSLKVRAGDRVRLGDEIGTMGRTGRAYAVHLHYELRFDGETVDPLYTGKRSTF